MSIVFCRHYSDISLDHSVRTTYVSEAVVGSETVVDSMEQEKHSKIPCAVCSCTLNSETQAQAHFSGIRHLKQLERHGLPLPEGVSRDKLFKRNTQQSGKIFLKLLNSACCVQCASSLCM